MKNALLSAAFLAAILAPRPAEACLGRQFEEYVFVAEVPKNLPTDLTWLRVEAPVRLKGWAVPEVMVLEGPNRLSGRFIKKVRVSPGIWTSCSRWGQLGKPSYVIGIWTVDQDGRGFFAAIQQSPSK